MKKNILRTAFVFSISIIGILNFNLLVSNGSISGLKLNDLFVQATAACENPGDVYNKSDTPEPGVAMPFLESYEKHKDYRQWAGPSGCICFYSSYQTGCAWTTDWTKYCAAYKTESYGCS